MENLLSTLSAIGIGTLIPAILLFVTEGKRVRADHITVLREYWRKGLRLKLKNLSSLINDLEKHLKNDIGIKFDRNNVFDYRILELIEGLRDTLSPYGMKYMTIGRKSIKNNVHIWVLLDIIENNVKKATLDGNKMQLSRLKLLRDFLRHLRKNDWENSKNEVKFSVARGLFIGCRLLLGFLALSNIFISIYYISLTRFDGVILFIISIITIALCFSIGILVEEQLDLKLCSKTIRIVDLYFDIFKIKSLIILSSLVMLEVFYALSIFYEVILGNIVLWNKTSAPEISVFTDNLALFNADYVRFFIISVVVGVLSHILSVYFLSKIYKKDFEYISYLSDLRESYPEVFSEIKSRVSDEDSCTPNA